MKTVLVFGDSNSWGWSPGNDFIKPVERWSADVRWTGVMQKELGGGFKVLVDGATGRTTVWDDPFGEFCSSKGRIVSSMAAAAPIDLLIIFVGTNDLYFPVSAQDIADGAALLARKALARAEAFADGKPKVILVGPPPLGPVSNGIFREMFVGREEKSKQLGAHYKAAADFLGVDYFDAAAVVKSSDLDGVHLDADQHELLGKAMAVTVKKAIG